MTEHRWPFAVRMGLLTVAGAIIWITLYLLMKYTIPGMR